jgi:hypothetical protein
MKKNLILFLFAVSSFCSFGQKIDDVFKTMPDSILPGLSGDNKIMMLMDTGKTVIPYQLGAFEKLSHRDSYLNIRSSEVGTTQIKLLTLINNSKIVCVVKTVCSAVCDSQIAFYSTAWEKLEKNSLLPDIDIESFFDSSKKGSDNYKFAVSLPDILPVKACFEGGGDDLTFSIDFSSYLMQEDREQMKPFLKTEQLVLKWNKTRFQP